MNLVFVLAWIFSVLGSLLLGAVAITYVRRTWQLIRAEEDDPTRERLLDGLDHLETQIHLVSQRLGTMEDRLAGIERGLTSPDDEPAEPALPPGDPSGTDRESSPPLLP